jgi:peptidoglycan/LPS O-acetylase OafA/YrhL
VMVIQPWDHRTNFLDGIRGLAALIVVLGHCSNAGIHVILDIDLSATAKIGVWLFFVLSAYLLASRLIDQFERGGGVHVVAGYAVRRILRIMPLYGALLLGLATFGAMNAPTMIKHLALVEGSIHLWTIPVEMKFYAVLPVVALALATLRPTRQPWVACAALVVAFLWFMFAVTPPRLAGNTIRLDVLGRFFLPAFLLRSRARRRRQRVERLPS